MAPVWLVHSRRTRPFPPGMPDRPRVLVREPIAEAGVELLRSRFDVDVDGDSDLAETIAGYDAIVIRSATQLTGEVIARADRLKVIGRAGVGVDNVDVDAATRRGIVVANAPDSTVVSISDPDRFTVQFTDNNRLSLRADCNRGFGGFSSNGNSINVGPVGITKAYCVETAPLDDEYVSLLNGDNTVTLTATSLQLSSARGTLRFLK